MINTSDELVQKMNDENINNLLLGNGFCLSHPTLGDCFQWDMHEALCREWANILPDRSKNCPEKDLNEIRLRASKRILNYYINRLRERLSPDSSTLNDIYTSYVDSDKNPYTCFNFLSALSQQEGHIFTLNYDPLMYFEILQNPSPFLDGFLRKGNDFQQQCSITNNLKKKNSSYIRILYLHGSWFILANDQDELRKLRFGAGSEDTVDTLFDNRNRPFLILEDRWRTKEAILQHDPYLRFCFEQLGQASGNLLIFGCSFDNDDHILTVIRNNPNLENIFVCYVGNNKAALEEKFRNFPIVIEYWPVSDHVIWEQIPLPGEHAG